MNAKIRFTLTLIVVALLALALSACDNGGGSKLVKDVVNSGPVIRYTSGHSYDGVGAGCAPGTESWCRNGSENAVDQTVNQYVHQIEVQTDQAIEQANQAIDQTVEDAVNALGDGTCMVVSCK